MKKLIMISSAFLLALSVSSQSTPSSSMSAVEANRANGAAEPKMPNGKPYSQWVAEEKAKKTTEQTPGFDKSTNSGLAAGPASAAPAKQVSQGTDTKTPPAPARPVEASVVKTELPKAIPMSELPGAALETDKPVPTKEVASRKGTSQDPDAQPLPTGVKQKGNEGGAVTPVERAVVKAPTKDAVVPQGKAPVAPTTVEEKNSETNSTNGEKPAQVPPAKQQ